MVLYCLSFGLYYRLKLFGLLSEMVTSKSNGAAGGERLLTYIIIQEVWLHTFDRPVAEARSSKSVSDV